MNVNTYPLAWPEHFPRTGVRKPSRFNSSIGTALANVQASIRRFAADSQKHLDNIVISSNVTMGNNYPKDPGVAIWFIWDGMEVCIPVDRYTTVEANLQAIYHIMEARRVELRHGSLHIVRATFQGFLLAAPPTKPWYQVLGCTPRTPYEEIRRNFKRLASIHHPDRPGGNHEKMTEINEAWKQAQFVQ